jgi:uncharacterized membrane protein YgdD (TMEM256/DUF423 family)
MNKEQKKMLIIGAVLLVVGIVLGAFGAHGLKKIVSTDKIETFEVGVKYQLYHGLAFLILANVQSFVNFNFKSIRILMILGVFLFSGSIYMLVFQEVLNFNLSFILGPLTPIGGTLLIIAWTLFIVKLTKEKEKVI